MFAMYTKVTIVAALLLVLASCYQSPSGDLGEPIDRLFSPYVQIVGAENPNNLIGSAPVTLLVDPIIQEPGFVPAVSHYAFSRIEVDFGEGFGWHDITDAMKLRWDHRLLGTLTAEDDILYTFENPGVYTVNFRITFPDSEVLQTGDHGSPPRVVTVLAP